VKNARSFYPAEEHVARVRPGDAGHVYIKPSSEDHTEARETAWPPVSQIVTEQGRFHMTHTYESYGMLDFTL